MTRGSARTDESDQRSPSRHDGVDVVVVTHQSRAHIRSCLAPLVGVARVNTFVVDNASTDGTVDAIRDLDVPLTRLAENIGFAAACNLGASLGDACWLLLLNPDASITPDDVDRLVRVMADDPSVGAVAPLLQNPDGSIQHSQGAAPSAWHALSVALLLHRRWPKLDGFIHNQSAYRARRPVDWALGACILIRRDVFEELGGLDDRYFLYGEDVDFCIRVRKAGYSVLFEPAARASHVGGASVARAELVAFLAESRIRVARQHRGRFAAAAERVAAFVGSALRIAEPGRNSTSRAAHGRVMGVVLRSESARVAPDGTRPRGREDCRRTSTTAS